MHTEIITNYSSGFRYPTLVENDDDDDVEEE
jgi:hypothetical protein